MTNQLNKMKTPDLLKHLEEQAAHYAQAAAVLRGMLGSAPTTVRYPGIVVPGLSGNGNGAGATRTEAYAARVVQKAQARFQARRNGQRAVKRTPAEWRAFLVDTVAAADHPLTAKEIQARAGSASPRSGGLYGHITAAVKAKAIACVARTKPKTYGPAGAAPRKTARRKSLALKGATKWTPEVWRENIAKIVTEAGRPVTVRDIINTLGGKENPTTWGHVKGAVRAGLIAQSKDKGPRGGKLFTVAS